ncbi:MAG: metallophosphoesterase [Victivallales bacterium]|nr:metallophosphoesterase [Victivallales bacterium]
MNIYVWWRLKCAFVPRSLPASLVLLCLILFFLFSPMFVNRSQSAMMRCWSQFCWCWLAWSFWLACSFLLVDVLNLAVGCVSHLLNKETFLFPLVPDLAKGCIAVGVVVFFSVWGVVEAYSIKVRQIDIDCPFAPEGGYRIAYVSDVHIGAACSQRKFNKIKGMLDGLEADLLLSGGDLVDGKGIKEENMAKALNELKIKRRIGVYGNHDVYTGLDYSRRLHEEAGFTLLENEGTDVEEWLSVYGETDPANGAAPETPMPAEGKFSILLKHRPDAWKKGGYDLQLSGHSHGGQIFPFNFLVRMQYPCKEGKLQELEGGTRLYVSNGTGLWGPPFRVMARPEITVFNLRRKIK